MSDLKLLFFSLLMCFASLFSGVYAQEVAFEWVKKFDTTSLGRDITVDASGNIYAAGVLSGTPTIYKLDASGNTLWTKHFIRNASGSVELKGIFADNFNNIYVTGYFFGAVDFDPGADSFVLTSQGAIANSFNGYIAKLDTSGNLLWARQLGIGARQAYLNDIAVDAWGNVLTTGRFVGTGDFDPGTDTFLLSTNSTNTSLHNIVVSKLDSSGNFVWAKQFSGSGGSSDGISITTDRWGNVLVGGSFRNTINFDPGGTNISFTVFSGVDGFITKLDSSGSFRWVKHIAGQTTGTSNAREIYDMVADSMGMIYVTGYFSHAANFDVGISNQVLTAVNGYDAIVAKYDSAGALVWISQFGGFAGDIGRGIALDSDYNVYTTGTFSDSVDFDPGSGTYFLKTRNNPNAYYTDIYISKLDNDGSFLWAKSMGGKQIDQADRIALDGSRNIYTVGYFQSDSCDFDPDPNAEYIVSVLPPPIPQLPQLLNNEIFVHKMGCADTTSSLQIVDACDAFKFNDEEWVETGVYVRAVPGSSGCDSTVTFDLTIHEVNAVISVDSFVLSTTQTYNSYQWLLNGNAIPNATEGTYEVRQNGNYQVIVTNEYGCTDTSDVYVVNNVSTHNIVSVAQDVIVYPNPAEDVIYIESPVAVYIQLTSIEGKKIKTADNTGMLNIADVPKGIYFLNITDESGVLLKVEKIVKQ